MNRQHVSSPAGVSYSTDLWALGCVVYQMLVGSPPFRAASEYLTFQRITALDLDMPADMPPAAADLVSRLLQLEPKQRLGAQDWQQLMAHEFFHGIDWRNLRSGPAPEYEAPPAPGCQGEEEGLDWEFGSLMREAPVHYEYSGS